MRVKAVFFSVVVGASVAASTAFAAGPPSHPGPPQEVGQGPGAQQGGQQSSDPNGAPSRGKPPRLGAGCRPQVTFVFKGDLVSTATDSLTMNVTTANAHAKSFVGKQLLISVAPNVMIVRQGRAKLSDLQAGDQLLAQVRDCKDIDTTTMTPVALRVIAHPASTSSNTDESTSDTTTTGGSGTTGSTTPATSTTGN